MEHCALLLLQQQTIAKQRGQAREQVKRVITSADFNVETSTFSFCTNNGNSPEISITQRADESFFVTDHQDHETNVYDMYYEQQTYMFDFIITEALEWDTDVVTIEMLLMRFGGFGTSVVLCNQNTYILGNEGIEDRFRQAFTQARTHWCL